jgi:uncharacterized protein YuzB (UPF0349 family)
MVIEICETNEAHQLLPDLRARFPQAEFIVHRCLNRCAGCFLCLFAFVDGQLIEAFEPTNLCDMIQLYY